VSTIDTGGDPHPIEGELGEADLPHAIAGEEDPGATKPDRENNLRSKAEETPGELHLQDTLSSRVHITLEVSEGTHVRITVESPAGSTPAPSHYPEENKEGGSPSARVTVENLGAGGEPVITFEPGGGPGRVGTVYGTRAAAGLPLGSRLGAAVRSWPYSLEVTLFVLSLVIYLATRLIGLAEFPIYFFTDEAVQTLAAADLVRDNFRNEEGILLPTYFKNGPYYNLSTSVYVQVLPYLFFGKSVFVTRATSVLISLLAAAAVGLILRDIFKAPYWWAGTLLLSIAPAWFLHSRTAFETVIFVSFYAAFLYAYLLYRCKDPRSLYLAVLLAALAFYSYSPGQFVVGLTALLLLASDWRYHWQNRRLVLRGLGLLVLLALPYLRFRLSHPVAIFDHLRTLGSYWVQPLPLSEKLARYGSEYLYGLSPGYWFIPNERDLPRHLMKGYGHLLRPTLPFAAVGLILALRALRSPAHRAVLIALLAAPAGSALVQVGVTRALSYVVPATLLIALGISWALGWLESKKLPHRAAALGLFALLALANLAMFRDSLARGPTWYQDYGLGGMQYGARQLFPYIQEYLASNPGTTMIVSPTWANGTDMVARFFLGDPFPIQMGSIDGHLFQKLPLDENTLFVMTPEEYQKTLESGKFTDIRVEDTLPYPNGKPGFYFVRLAYVGNIDQILDAEREERRQLRTAEVVIDGQVVQVRHSLLDMGEAQHMFDGDPETLGRTLEANPAIVELIFPGPREISKISLNIGSTQAELRAWIYATAGSEPAEIVRTLQGSIDKPVVTLDLGQAYLAEILRLEVRDTRQAEPGNVHVWEIELD
jgi:4-amino-4-deoxy-L-arabinose transferase-like glycosyltransferase